MAGNLNKYEEAASRRPSLSALSAESASPSLETLPGNQPGSQVDSGEASQAPQAIDVPKAPELAVEAKGPDAKALADAKARIREEGALQSDIAGAVRPLYQKRGVLEELQSRAKAPEDEETRKKREKRERSRRIIGAVSDGLRSLGNLFFTSQYAPDMYKGSTSQYEKTNEWIEKARAQREKDEDAYYNLSMRIGDLDGEIAKTARDLRNQHEAQRQAKEAAAMKKAKHEAEMKRQPYLDDKAKAEAEGAGYKRDSERVKAAYEPYQQEAKLANEGKKGAVYDSQVQKNKAQAYKAWSEGKKPFHFDGQEYWKDNENDYIKDITAGADEVNAYYAEKNPDGTLKKDSEGKVVYRKGFDPIDVSYMSYRNGETKYYAWAETASKVEHYLDKMRKEKADAKNKQGGAGTKGTIPKPTSTKTNTSSQPKGTIPGKN